MRSGHDRAVVMEPEVAAAFVVVEAEFAFELAVVQFDDPPQSGQARETLGLGVGWEVGDPVVAGTFLTFGPLDDQPFLAGGAAVTLDRVGAGHAEHREAGAQLVLVAGPERERLELVGVKSAGEI